MEKQARKSEAELEQVATKALEGMREWRNTHLGASFKEIELETDRRLAELRARMIEEAVHASQLAEINEGTARPLCAQCHCELVKNGKRRRELRSSHEQRIAINRQHMVCPQCGAGFFPPR